MILHAGLPAKQFHFTVISGILQGAFHAPMVMAYGMHPYTQNRQGGMRRSSSILVKAARLKLTG